MTKSALRPGLSVAKLRAAFIALAVALLAGLSLLSTTMQKRLEEARVQREEMVALRVFDELEREVSAFLDGESEREHYEKLQETDPKSWAPFVVGYFKTTPGDPELVGADAEAVRRMRWALAQSDVFLAPSKSLDPLPKLDEARGQRDSGVLGGSSLEAPAFERAPPALSPVQPVKKKSESKPKPTTKGSEIIQQLNRATERRKAAPSSASPQKSEKSDQFLDYTESY